MWPGLLASGEAAARHSLARGRQPRDVAATSAPDLEPPCDEYKLAATGLSRLSCRARSTTKHLTRRAVAEVEENMSCTTAG
ncbi:hypothetical protein EJB05_00995 [Eragrostis curvula]|uniref:Uncharacterized protein n=1 Tax=Eragrostis curvula TaxID=38414 RepID=A0A5J9WN96_9POAL|nr:hypothetical protein EJB05_00995 [Eragrostis curvula]